MGEKIVNYREGQIVMYVDNRGDDVKCVKICRVDADGAVYLLNGFLSGTMSEIARANIRPLTQKERGPR